MESMFTGDLMEQALGAAFGKIIDDALQPILVRLTEIETVLATLSTQQSTVADAIETVKAKGGMLGKMLGG